MDLRTKARAADSAAITTKANIARRLADKSGDVEVTAAAGLDDLRFWAFVARVRPRLTLKACSEFEENSACDSRMKSRSKTCQKLERLKGE